MILTGLVAKARDGGPPSSGNLSRFRFNPPAPLLLAGMTGRGGRSPPFDGPLSRRPAEIIRSTRLRQRRRPALQAALTGAGGITLL
ncbi:hypothetical protein GCM10008965_36800 [Methylorubrum aminovorans]